MRNRTLVALAAGCFFFSGAAGLLYEVAWLRFLGLAFGHTVYAVTTVLAAYMGGLALGSLLLGRWADRVARPLRAYGLVEGAVGLFCLATPLLFRGADAAYLAFYRALRPSALGAGLAQFAVSAALLVVPTTLMGATLPLLSRAVVERAGSAGSRVGTLYAINTWGAVAGVGATGFFLLPALGLRATIWLGVGLNLLVAGAAILIDRRLGSATPAEAPPAEAPPAPEPAPSGEAGPATSRGAVWVALVAIGVSGAASMAYEIAWTRALSLVLGSSTYAFSAMLATFLVGLALGALAVSRLLRRRALGLAAFGVVECAIALAVVLLLPLFGQLPEMVLWLLGRTGLSHGGALLAQFGASFLVMIVPTALVGATLPLVIAALAGRLASLGKDVGRVYGANTVGTIAGAAAAGFLLVPLAGIQRGVVAAAAANLAAGVAVLVAAAGPARRRRFAAAGFAVAFAAAVALLPQWDRQLMASGVSVYASSYLDRPGALRERLKEREVVFYAEGLNTTVSVSATRDGRELTVAVNGKIDASNRYDMMTQLLLGHLPALLAPEARRALVIGLGSGVTAGAIAQHPLESIEVAELEPAMIEAARFFSRENRGVLQEPRVRIVAGDGRHILAAAARPYDLVVSEPSNPWIAGVGNLFTREFYLTAREHLSERGIMVQWLQGYNIFPREMQMVVRTFQEVFPHATVWQAGRGDYLLVAARTPLAVDFPAVERAFAESPATRADLGRYGIGPEDLLHHFVLSEEDARRYSAGAPLNTDDRPLLEFAAPRALYATKTTETNEQLLHSFQRAEWPAVLGADAARLTGPEGRLRAARASWLWGDVAQAWRHLDRVGPLDGKGEALRLERARLLLATGRLGEAVPALEALGRDHPGDAVVARWLRAGRVLQAHSLGPDLARQVWVWEGDPDATLARFGAVLVGFGVQTRERDLLPLALEQFESALERDPSSPELLTAAGRTHLGMGQYGEAIAAYRRVLEGQPGSALAHFNLGIAYQASGIPAEAAGEYEEATRLDPAWSQPREALAGLRGSGGAPAQRVVR